AERLQQDRAEICGELMHSILADVLEASFIGFRIDPRTAREIAAESCNKHGLPPVRLLPAPLVITPVEQKTEMQQGVREIQEIPVPAEKPAKLTGYPEVNKPAAVGREAHFVG